MDPQFTNPIIGLDRTVAEMFKRVEHPAARFEGGDPSRVEVSGAGGGWRGCLVRSEGRTKAIAAACATFLAPKP